jgi:TPR repeat protein
VQALSLGLDSALHYLGRACALGSPTGCFRAADVSDDWMTPGEAEGLLPSRRIESACDDRSPGACLNAAMAAEDRLLRAPPARQVGVQARGARAAVARAYRDACDARILQGCTRLGMLFSDGRLGHPASADSALHYLALGCGGGRDSLAIGDGAACTHLGRLYAGTAGAGAGEFPADTIRMIESFWAGCSLLESEACAELAYHGFRAGKVPGPAALLRAATACEEGSGYGCRTTAWLYEQEFSADPRQVIRYRRRACTLGYPAACTEAARRADGLEEQYQRIGFGAMKFARRACALRDGDGCMLLAQMLAPQTNTRALPVPDSFFVSRACDAGSAEACRQMAQLARRAGREEDEGLYHTRACLLAPTRCKKR